MPPKPPYNEHELLQYIADGDSAAFQTLFNHYYPALCYFASRLTGSRTEAEDIVMDVFTRFWQKKEQADGIGNASYFLYASVRHGCLDFLRKDNRSPVVHTGDGQAIAADDNAIEGEAVFTRVLHQVYQEIEALPPQCRSIFKLLYFEGRSTREIADILRVSIQTVRNQKTRALQILRLKLERPELMSLAMLETALQWIMNGRG